MMIEYVPIGFYCYGQVNGKYKRCSHYLTVKQMPLYGLCNKDSHYKEIMDQCSICEKDSDEKFYKRLEKENK